MLTLIRILSIVYYIAINVYSFMLVFTQKRGFENGECNVVRDGSLFVSALLGGAGGIYIAMFTFKYRLRSLFLMVFMPVLIVLHAYLITVCFINDFWLINDILNVSAF